MIATKNQIRPRRQKFHFTNADILALDTVGLYQLVVPAPLNHALAMEIIQVRTNIVVPYGNIGGTNPFLSFVDDFQSDGIYFEDFHNSSNFSFLFSGVGLNLIQSNGQELIVVNSGSPQFIDPRDGIEWTDAADLAANGGIYLRASNDGSDLTDGDPANFLDIFVQYAIVNLGV